MKLFWNEEEINKLESGIKQALFKIKLLEEKLEELENKLSEAGKSDNKDWLSRL